MNDEKNSLPPKEPFYIILEESRLIRPMIGRTKFKYSNVKSPL